MWSPTLTTQIYPASSGGYVNGRLLMPFSATGPEDSIKWAQARLIEAQKQDNRVTWGVGQLRIVADMMRDRGQTALADEVLRIAEGISPATASPSPQGAPT